MLSIFVPSFLRKFDYQYWYKMKNDNNNIVRG